MNDVTQIRYNFYPHLPLCHGFMPFALMSYPLRDVIYECPLFSLRELFRILRQKLYLCFLLPTKICLIIKTAGSLKLCTHFLFKKIFFTFNNKRI